MRFGGYKGWVMRAIVLKEPEHLELMDIPEPKLLDAGEVLIKVEACGICGSDLRYWAGENPWALHTLGRHVDNPPNLILGHEFAGVVAKVNSDEYAHLLGRRVGVQSFRSCGACRFCITGRQNLCQDMIHIGHAQGWDRRDFYPGAYAEYCIGWADLLHPISDNVSFAEAALGDIYCVAVHAVRRTRLYDGAAVLCIGGGPAGLSIAQVAKRSGAEKIALSDTSHIARSIIGHFAELTVLDPMTQDINVAIEDMWQGQKCAAVFDTVGTVESMTTGIRALEESGTYVNLAVHDENVSMNAAGVGSERTVTSSSNAHYRDLTDAFALINDGDINVKPLITHRYPLEDFDQAFHALLDSPRTAFKVVFEPWIEG